jgi:hypothetical protein
VYETSPEGIHVTPTTKTVFAVTVPLIYFKTGYYGRLFKAVSNVVTLNYHVYGLNTAQMKHYLGNTLH